MKFILFDINDNNKTKINNYYFDKDKNNEIKEINISSKDLKKMMNKDKSIFNKINKKIVIKKFEKIIKKVLLNDDFKWYYFLSKNFTSEQKNFLKIEFESLLGYEFIISSEMDKNIFKYIDNFALESNLKLQDIKILLVYPNSISLSLSLVKNLLNEYKNVDIYINENPSNYILKQIKNINKNYGTTTEILKYDKKSFKEYNVIYFVNLFRNDFSKFRFNKNALIIDNNLAYDDKYNSYNIFVKNYIDCKDNDINYLIEKYGKLEIAVTFKNTI